MITFLMCSWHEHGQLRLAGFNVSHGACPICQSIWLQGEQFKTVLEHMKHGAAEWPQLIRDGGWERFSTGTYWAGLRRVASSGHVIEIYHRGNHNGFNLYVNNQHIATHDSLDDALEQGGAL